jgi:hypothetical protein
MLTVKRDDFESRGAWLSYEYGGSGRLLSVIPASGNAPFVSGFGEFPRIGRPGISRESRSICNTPHANPRATPTNVQIGPEPHQRSNPKPIKAGSEKVMAIVETLEADSIATARADRCSGCRAT